MSDVGSQLSPSKRPKWQLITMGISLIVVAVALTVAWQILAAPDQATTRELATLRWVAYFFGSLLFLLLIAGLVLIVLLLLREVRLNERQSELRERGDPRAEDAGGLAPPLPRHPAAPRAAPRAAATSSTGPCARTSTA